jgi:hypothetical protein
MVGGEKMKNVDIIMSYWKTIDNQDWNKLKCFFTDLATVEWPNTNEIFVNINNFIRANNEYPGNWTIDVERIEEVGNTAITVSKVSLREQNISVHVVSIFEITNDKIEKLIEYWGDDGAAPEWRQKLNLSLSLNKLRK